MGLSMDGKGQGAGQDKGASQDLKDMTDGGLEAILYSPSDPNFVQALKILSDRKVERYANMTDAERHMKDHEERKVFAHPSFFNSRDPNLFQANLEASLMSRKRLREDLQDSDVNIRLSTAKFYGDERRREGALPQADIDALCEFGLKDADSRVREASAAALHNMDLKVIAALKQAGFL